MTNSKPLLLMPGLVEILPPAPAESNSASTGEAADPPAGAPSVEQFAAESARIVEEAGAAASPGAAEGAAGASADQGAAGAAGANSCRVDLGGIQFDVDAKAVRLVLEKISNAVAVRFQDPELALEDWEYELWTPCGQFYVNKYLPLLMKWLMQFGGSEGMALLMAALAAYAINRPQKVAELFEVLWQKFSGVVQIKKGQREVPKEPGAAGQPSPSATPTPDSAASKASSGSPAPEKLTVPPASYAAPAEQSFTIPSVM